MSTKKPTPAQLAARKRFAEMSKNGTLAKKKGLGSPASNKERIKKTLATLETAYKNAKTSSQKANLQELINNTKAALKQGLNGADTKTKGLTTLCARSVGVEGRRKSNGTQKKGYIAKKGGTLKKAPKKK